MTQPVDCLRMQHINAVVNGQERSLERFAQLHGAQLLKDMPHDEWQSCLVAFPGPAVFEIYSPRDPLLNMRFGPHFEFGPNYVGVEYQVPDVGVVRRKVVDEKRRILRERIAAFHMHPGDGYGVAWEFFDRDFYTDAGWIAYLEPMRPASYWRDEHPLGCLGMKGYSVAVTDLEGARRFYETFVNGSVLFEEDRPSVGARAVGISLADMVVELLAPTGEGVIAHHLGVWGGGIRSPRFQVRDLEAARTHYRGKGVELVPGDTPDTLAIRPEDNCGLRFEYTE